MDGDGPSSKAPLHDKNKAAKSRVCDAANCPLRGRPLTNTSLTGEVASAAKLENLKKMGSLSLRADLSIFVKNGLQARAQLKREIEIDRVRRPRWQAEMNDSACKAIHRPALSSICSTGCNKH